MNNIEKDTPVECIDDQFFDETTNPFRISELNLPQKGLSYIVRDVTETNHGTGILLEEIKNARYFFDDIRQEREPVFSIRRFKKKQ